MTTAQDQEVGQTLDTFKTVQQGPPRFEHRDACIVYIYPTGPLMGQRYPLAAGPVLIVPHQRNDAAGH